MKPPSFTVSSPGPLLGTTLVIDRDEMVLGRRPDCDLVLADEFVSRRHAILSSGPAGVSVVDLGSTGKTFVNGQPIGAATPLRDGDSVRFGQVDTVFHAGTADEPTAVENRPQPAPGVVGPPRRSVLVDGAIVCLECGTRNPMGTVFCSNPDCGSFLEFTGAGAVAGGAAQAAAPDVLDQPPMDDTAVHERPERRPPHEETRVEVAVTLAPKSLAVAPGGEAACEVTVTNTGTLVDAVTVAVIGDAAAWATVEPAQLRLMPGSKQVAAVRFQPPREPGARAGPAPFEVRASSGNDATTASGTDGVLTVGAFHEMSVQLVPSTSRGARVGAHRLTVANGGNAPLSVDVVADDPDELLQLSTSPSHLQIEPGMSAASRVQVRARRRLWWGPSRNLPLRVTARPASGDPVKADGAFAQRPLFPKWFRKALLWPVGLTVAGVIALLLVARPWQQDPKPIAVANCVTPPQDEAGCMQLLVNAGLTAQVRRESNGTAPVNAVLRTEPAPGALVKRGSLVTVTVSDGLKVPADVVGRTEQDARNILTGLGFVVPTPPGMEEGGQRGLVVRTLPPPGSVLLAGQTVEIVVATGPTTTTTTASTTTSTVAATTTTARATTTTVPATTSTAPATTTTVRPTTSTT